MKSGKYYIYCINTIKSPKTFSTIWSSHYNNGKKYGCDKRTFDLPKDVDANLKHEIKFIIKSNESLVENKIKNEDNYCLYICMETIFTDKENSKTNELHKLVPNLSQRLDLIVTTTTKW